MTWPRFHLITLDINHPSDPIIQGTSGLSREIKWTQGDRFDLRLQFKDSLNGNAIQQLEPTHTIAVGAKETVNGQPTGDLLFSASSFTEAGDPDWHYTAELNLNTVEMDAAFAADGSSKTVQVDVEVQDSSGYPITFQFPVTILPEAYDNEDDPADAIAAGGDSRAYADIDWTQTGNTDVAVPDGFILEELILMAEKDGATGEDLTGLVFDVGTTSDQDAYLAAEGPFTDLERYALDELTDGTVRIAITSAGSEGTDGRAILKGSRL